MNKSLYIVTLHTQTKISDFETVWMDYHDKTLVWANTKPHAIRKALRVRDEWLRRHGYKDEYVHRTFVIYVQENVNLASLARTAKWCGTAHL